MSGGWQNFLFVIGVVVAFVGTVLWGIEPRPRGVRTVFRVAAKMIVYPALMLVGPGIFIGCVMLLGTNFWWASFTVPGTALAFLHLQDKWRARRHRRAT